MTSVNFGRDSNNLGVRVLKGTSLLVAARLIVRSFSLLNIVILARLLTPEDYGIAALAMAGIGLFATLSDLRLTTALTAIDEVEADHLNTAFTLALLRGIILVAAIFLSADAIARWMETPELATILRVLSVIFLFGGVSNPAFWMYQRNLDFSKEFGRATLAQAAASALTIASAFYFRSYWAIVIGTLVASFINSALSYWRVDFRPRLGLRRWRVMLSFGGWLSLEGFARQLNLLAPRVLIPKLLSPAALGIFTVGREAVSLPLDELVDPLRRTFFPSFSAIKNEPERLRRVVRLAVTTVLGVALPIGVGIAVLAREVLLVLVGGQWLQADIVLQVLGPTMALLLTTSPVAGLMIAKGKLKPLFLQSLGLALFVWAGIYVGLSRLGFEGAVYAIGLTQIVTLGVNLAQMRWLIGEPVLSFIANGWRSVVAAALMAAAVTWVTAGHDVDASTGSLRALLHILPAIAIGATVYTASHLLLWRLAGRPDGFEANALYYCRLMFSAARVRLGR